MLACASDAPTLDATAREDGTADSTATDTTVDARDASDVTDASDVVVVIDTGRPEDARVADAKLMDAVLEDVSAMDAGDGGGDALTDIIFSERREVEIPDGAVCEAVRADGGVNCREENVGPGTGLFCIRYSCDVDDGGTSLDGCCRLIG